MSESKSKRTLHRAKAKMHIILTNYVMPANKRPRRLNYSVNKKGPVTGGKVGGAIKHFKKLRERTAFEGETKWLQNAMSIVLVKLKKYGINPNKI